MPVSPAMRRGQGPGARFPGPWAQARGLGRFRLKTASRFFLPGPRGGQRSHASSFHEASVPRVWLHVQYKRPPLGTATIVLSRDRAVGMPARRFGIEHLGDADFETEETRVRQNTPPRTSISRGSPGREIPGRRPFPGDPKEEIHCWMTTNLWAREHELDERKPALTEVEELRELVLHLRGVVEGT